MLNRNSKSFTGKSAGTILLIALLTVCMLLMGAAVPQRAAAEEVSTATATLSPDISVVVDGVDRAFYDASGVRVYPVLYNGTNYLPVRAIGELMGKNVNWDQATLTISLTSPRTTAKVPEIAGETPQIQQITIDVRPDFTILVDGVKRTFADESGKTVYPILRNGTTYLPVRAIGELMGKTVSWDGETRTVTLAPKDSLVTDADTFNPTNPSAPADPSRPSTGNSNAQPSAPNGQTFIGVDAAKEKALAHAKLTADQVTFHHSKLERDDGRYIYDIEFYTNDNKEYDYEIDALTGEILSFDTDIESHRASHHTPSADPNAQGVIGTEKARTIVLAEVTGASANDVKKLKLDSDDGRRVYECEIVYGNYEYEFEIDALTGEIVSSDRESVWD